MDAIVAITDVADLVFVRNALEGLLDDDDVVGIVFSKENNIGGFRQSLSFIGEGTPGMATLQWGITIGLKE